MVTARGVAIGVGALAVAVWAFGVAAMTVATCVLAALVGGWRVRAARHAMVRVASALVDRVYRGVLLAKLGLLLAAANRYDGATQHADTRVDTCAVWFDFCDELRNAGAELVLRRPPPGVRVSTHDRTEGVRYLARLARGGLESFVENADVLAPALLRLPYNVKLGADNPDNAYAFASISATHDYVIVGQRGTVHYLSIGAYAGVHPGRKQRDGGGRAGLIDGSELHLDDDAGNFVIHLTHAPRPRYAKNWIELHDDSEKVLVRQTYLDRRTERLATLDLRVVWPDERRARDDEPAVSALRTPPGAAPRLTPIALVSQLSGASMFALGAANQFLTWTHDFASRPNTIAELDPRVAKAAWADPNLRIWHGYWTFQHARGGDNDDDDGDASANTLDDDTAERYLLVHVRNNAVDCDFWNFQLNNWWMESLDYEHRHVATNKHTARLPPRSLRDVLAAPTPPPQPRVADAEIRIVVTRGRWDADVEQRTRERLATRATFIDSCAHDHGTMALRCVRGRSEWRPEVRLLSRRALVELFGA